MIIIKIFGGLGNQLFQYSFGKYLELKLNTIVKYDIQTNKKIKNFTSRDIELQFLNISLEIATEDEIKKLKYFTSGILSRIERKIAQKLPCIIRSYFVEPSVQTIINYQNLKDNCYYDGYWQSYKYLSDIEIAPYKEISKKNFLVDKETQATKILSNESISIHIRRGDYLSIKKNSEIFSVCDMSYYEKAILYITQRLPKPNFFIFSDDIDWAQRNFFGQQFYFIDGNIPSEDMHLMSLCKHNIIANSTFSWWAAWLNSNKNKIVIAPKQWYIGPLNKSTENLIPNSWIRM